MTVLLPHRAHLVQAVLAHARLLRIQPRRYREQAQRSEQSKLHRQHHLQKQLAHQQSEKKTSPNSHRQNSSQEASARTNQIRLYLATLLHFVRLAQNLELPKHHLLRLAHLRMPLHELKSHCQSERHSLQLKLLGTRHS